MSLNAEAGAAWTPAIPFTPSHVSVNRVRIVDLPGVPVDPEVRGQRAYDVVSVRALTRYARERAAALALPAAYLDDSTETQRELPRYVDACLRSADVGQRRAAQDIAVRLGRNLGHILAALHRGDAVNRAARDDWSDADWTRWARIRQVWLAGGLLSGEFGSTLASTAESWLADMGHRGAPRVRIDPRRRDLVLHGAARHLPPAAGHALGLDFGQTSVKRAVFVIEGGAIRLHRALPTIDAGERLSSAGPADPLVAARTVRDFVAAAVADSWARAECAGERPSADVIVGVAAYVNEGRLLGNGPYAAIHALGPDARPILNEAVSALAGRLIRIHPIHDGTAAAAMHAGEADTAVLVAGTALGIGFPPATAAGLLDLDITEREE